MAKIDPYSPPPFQKKKPYFIGILWKDHFLCKKFSNKTSTLLLEKYDEKSRKKKRNRKIIFKFMLLPKKKKGDREMNLSGKTRFLISIIFTTKRLKYRDLEFLRIRK